MTRRNLLMLMVLPALLVLLAALIWLLLLGGGEAPTGLPTETPDAEALRLLPDADAVWCAAAHIDTSMTPTGHDTGLTA